MRINAIAFLFALVVMSMCVGQAQTAPKPSIIPVSWQLEIKVERPQPIEVFFPGQAKPKLYWYLRYTLINNTGRDQIFVPNFLLYTETGQTILAGKKIPLLVFQNIKKRHNQPLLQTRTNMTGKILQGLDNAKQGVAIWPDFDPVAGKFDVFIGGISGETVEVTLPKPVVVTEKVISGNKRITKKVRKSKVTLHKVLHISYSISGEAAARISTIVQILSKTWLMR